MPFGGIFENVVAFLAVLMPVVFFHELGHYWVARKSGVIVDVFSIGFGPVLASWRDKAGTKWQIAAIPLGGYVKMKGDINAVSQAGADAQKHDGSFAGASLGQRFLIVLAGPVANFILAVFLFAGVYMVSGKAFIPAEIGAVNDGSAAASAGLKEGDIVRSIDGSNITDFADMRQIVMQSADIPLAFDIDRNGRLLSKTVTPEGVYVEQLGTTVGRLGIISAGGEFRRLGLTESLFEGGRDVVRTINAMGAGIIKLFSGNASMDELGGPVRIAEFSGDAARQGIISFVMFTALISINLGIVNLLPIPALDGGHLMIFTCEAILGRPLPEAVQGVLLRGGVALLLSLMLYVTIFDVIR